MTAIRSLDKGLFHLITGVSLRTKIVGMVLGAVLIIGLAMTLTVRARLAADLNRSLEERGVAIGRYVASRATDLVLTDNAFALYQLIRDTLENNLDVRYVFILDTDGQPLVHSFPHAVPSGLIAVNQPQPGQPYRLQLLNSDEGTILDVAVPILSGDAGYTRVGLSSSRLKAEVTQATWQLLTITAIALLVGMIIALLLTQVLIRPVLELVDVTRRLETGDLKARAQPFMADEIGELSHAFNAMAESLQASHNDLMRRLRELATLNATASAISSTLDLQNMLQAALSKVLEVMELHAGWIFLEHPHSPLGLRLTVQSGLSPKFAHEEATLHLGDCICDLVLQTGAPMVVENLAKDCPRLSSAVIQAEGLTCHASIPLVSRNRVIGVLNVASREERPFTSSDLSLLDSIGRQIGVAVENARLWEEVKEKEALRGQLLERIIAAQESERQRLARELHDETGQALTSLKFSLSTLEKYTHFPEAHAQLQSLRNLVGQIQDSLHDLAVELHPPALDELGLEAALKQLVTNFSRHTGLTVEMQTLGLEQNGSRLPAEMELTAYRLIQEALTNIIRHANAQQVSVLLERQSEQMILIVDDDGQGFDISGPSHQQTTRQHLGIHSMQERVELLGGVFTIESKPGEGTTVFARLPIPERISRTPN